MADSLQIEIAPNDARRALDAMVRPLTARGFERRPGGLSALFSLRCAELIQRRLM